MPVVPYLSIFRNIRQYKGLTPVSQPQKQLFKTICAAANHAFDRSEGKNKNALFENNAFQFAQKQRVSTIC
jgi:hypothetical protein